MSPFRTILFPADFSAPSRAAYEAALGLARDGGRLIVLHVDQPPPYSPPCRAEIAARLRRCYPPAPPAAVEYRVETGEPVTEILRVAAEARCGLIVMGTHEQGGVEWFFDSVTRQVLCQAPCPVMTVAGPPVRPPAAAG
jgi:nucleotide-binding universal stress UspA family protein